MFLRTKREGMSRAFPFLFLLGLFLSTALTGCGLFADDSLDDLDVELQDQNGETFNFPDDLKGKVVLVGYVYTHCPDICPMVTYNMRDIQRKVDSDNFMLVSISFDPKRDTPEILSQYAENYRLDLTQWSLLSGDSDEIDRVMNRLGIAVQKLPSRFMSDGGELYFMNHSDKVTLIDQNLNVVDEFMGSELDQEKALRKIEELLAKESTIIGP
jgi:protein SCO1/2